MDKEEQIKRLAQNLFNNGFTKSMDYAIQTAANMLGFPDSLVQSASSASQEAPSYSRDMARKLSQEMAQERVYSQIPGAVISAVQPAKSSQQSSQESQDMYDQSSYYTGSESMYSSSSPQREQFEEQENVEKPSLSLDYSGLTDNAFVSEETTIQESDDSLDFTSQQHIYDAPAQPVQQTEQEYVADENFIEKKEDTSHLESQVAFEEEEQTSLMSGYLNTYKGEESKNTPQRVEGDTISEDIFDSSFSQKSQFPKEFEVSEDFFTLALENRQVQPQQQPLVAQQNVVHQQQSAPKPMATPQVDITQMFNYRNLQNH